MNCPICALYFPVTPPPHVCGQDVAEAVHEWLDGVGGEPVLEPIETGVRKEMGEA